jgi:CubicO group peptidase (beta-lactamase class C family)
MRHLLCCAALLAAPALRAADALPRDLKRYDFAKVTEKLQGFLDDKTAEGFALVLVKDGAVVYEKHFGTFSKDTVIPIASASKLPTVMAVMTLADRKKVGLDDKVGKYLADWPADKADMTVRQTLSCMAGLAPRSAAFNNGKITLEEAARIIAKTKLQAKPGEAFIYGGNTFQVAARVAEVAGGKPWNDFFQDALGKPLGLSTFRYGPAGKNPWVAGGAACNLDDYARLVSVHLKKGMYGKTRVLSAEAIAEMQKDQVGSKKIQLAPVGAAVYRPYGLSWWFTPPEKGKPVTEFSDPGAFGTVPWIDTRRGYGGVLFLKKDLRTGTKIWVAVKPLIRAALDAK